MPECEGNESSKFHEKWLNNSMPFDEKSMLPEKCEKFRPILDSQEHFDCQSQSSFNRSDKVTDCSNFVYEDDELTILKQVIRVIKLNETCSIRCNLCIVQSQLR